MEAADVKFFIPIDLDTIKYDPKYPGPYIVPCKVTYEQTNHVIYTGDKLQGNMVVGEQKLHYLGPIRESKEYREVYNSIKHPIPEFQYEYDERLVQCQNKKCWKTEWWSSCPLYEFYDSFHDEYYDNGLSRACLWCGEELPLVFEKLDRPTLEKYAYENHHSRNQNN